MDEDIKKQIISKIVPGIYSIYIYLSLLLVVQFPKCRSHQPLLSPQLGCGALRHAGWAISLRWQSDAFGGATHAAVDEDFSRFFHWKTGSWPRKTHWNNWELASEDGNFTDFPWIFNHWSLGWNEEDIGFHMIELQSLAGFAQQKVGIEPTNQQYWGCK